MALNTKMQEETNSNQLKYDELKLGEKSLEVYRATLRNDFDLIERKYGAEARQVAEKGGVDAIRMWNAENLPTFLNRREVYRTRDGTVLTTTDLVIAQVLGGVNGFLMSDAGSGKSQLITDISNAYFNGDLRNNGNAIIQTANNDFRIASIMERRKADKPTELELSGAHKACFFGVDELTRSHPMVANEFSDLGNGVYHRGNFNVRLGKDEYFIVLATGNDPRKKENRGAMDWDGAMLNRFPVALDLGSDRFGIAGTEDDGLKTKIKPATTSVLYCKPTDLTDKVIDAYHQICLMSSDLGSESEAVFYFLSRGASVCPGKKKGTSGDSQPQIRKKSLLPQWPKPCVDCGRAKVGSGGNKRNSLCSLVNSENGRTMPNARRYASALDYLLKLKAKDEGRELDYDPKDLAFLSFELCGALQEGVLNQGILAKDYYNSNERMMSDVTEMLRNEFNRHGETFTAELDGIKKFGKDYFLVRTKNLERVKDGIYAQRGSLPEGAITHNDFNEQIKSRTFQKGTPVLKEGIDEIITSDYTSSEEASWDFATKVISQEKENADGK